MQRGHGAYPVARVCIRGHTTPSHVRVRDVSLSVRVCTCSGQDLVGEFGQDRVQDVQAARVLGVPARLETVGELSALGSPRDGHHRRGGLVERRLLTPLRLAGVPVNCVGICVRAQLSSCC